MVPRPVAEILEITDLNISSMKGMEKSTAGATALALGLPAGDVQAE